MPGVEGLSRWPNLEKTAMLQARMLRHELYSMIHVAPPQGRECRRVVPCFRIGTVRSYDLAVLPIQGQRGLRRLKRFSTCKMPVAAKVGVVFKACVEHPLLQTFCHCFK